MRLVHTRDFNLQLMSFGGGDGEIKTPGILSKPDIGKWGTTDKRVHQQQSEKNKCTEYFLFEESVEKNTHFEMLISMTYLRLLFFLRIHQPNGAQKWWKNTIECTITQHPFQSMVFKRNGMLQRSQHVLWFGANSKLT